MLIRAGVRGREEENGNVTTSMFIATQLNVSTCIFDILHVVGVLAQKQYYGTHEYFILLLHVCLTAFVMYRCTEMAPGKRSNVNHYKHTDCTVMSCDCMTEHYHGLGICI